MSDPNNPLVPAASEAPVKPVNMNIPLAAGGIVFCIIFIILIVILVSYPSGTPTGEYAKVIAFGIGFAVVFGLVAGYLTHKFLFAKANPEAYAKLYLQQQTMDTYRHMPMMFKF